MNDPQIEKEASDPKTPSWRLSELATNGEPEVRALVARNPSAAPGCLCRLAEEHWEEVVANPGLPLHLLEQPSWFAGLAPRALRAALASSKTPESWLDRLGACRGALETAVALGRGDLVTQWSRNKKTLREQGKTALFCALDQDQPGMLLLLLEQGQSPEIERDVFDGANEYRTDLLGDACLHQKHQALSALLSAGVLRAPRLKKQLKVEIFTARAETIRIFYKHGVTLGSPLLDAVARNDPEQVRAALEVPHWELRDALGLASLLGHAEEAHRLLAAGAPPGGQTMWGSTPLWMAMKSGHLEIARSLLHAGADPDEESTLLAEGSDPDTMPHFWNSTPLWFAVHEENLESASLLLQAGADPDLESWSESPRKQARNALNSELRELLKQAPLRPRNNGP